MAPCCDGETTWCLAQCGLWPLILRFHLLGPSGRLRRCWLNKTSAGRQVSTTATLPTSSASSVRRSRGRHTSASSIRFGVYLWGQRWFEDGCISSHFLNMVVEGDEVRPALTPSTAGAATIGAEKADGTPVLTGTASVGRDDVTDLDERRKRGHGDPGGLHIIDQISIGMDTLQGRDPHVVTMGFDEHNGPLYPFTPCSRNSTSITEPMQLVCRRWRQPLGYANCANGDAVGPCPQTRPAPAREASVRRAVHRPRSSLRQRPGVCRPELSARSPGGWHWSVAPRRVLVDRNHTHGPRDGAARCHSCSYTRVCSRRRSPIIPLIPRPTRGLDRDSSRANSPKAGVLVIQETVASDLDPLGRSQAAQVSDG